jgi:hypothetical protein
MAVHSRRSTKKRAFARAQDHQKPDNKNKVAKIKLRRSATEPDIQVMRSCVSRSVAEEQPQQNDHWNRHAQQPKQYSSSHHLLLKIYSRRKRIMPWLVPTDKTGQAEERFTILEFPRATIQFETASSRRDRPLRGLDVAGMAAARQPPFAFTRA